MELARDQANDFDHSPPAVISQVELKSKNIFIVRDDLLPGGTKQRAAIPYIAELMAQGINHFVYASPFSGFAQVALAYACSQLGARCSLYCEEDNNGHLHEFSRLAQSYGAKVNLCTDLFAAMKETEKHELFQLGTMVIPLGFNDSIFKSLLQQEIEKIWRDLTSQYEIHELWLPVGSGTLLSTIQKVVGPEVRIYGVNVNVLPESDPRISTIMNDPKVDYIRCQQKFHEPCQREAPVPSNLYYDAKLFAHLEERAQHGAFWWNVAR